MVIDVLEFMVGSPQNVKKSPSKSVRLSRKITQNTGRPPEAFGKSNLIFLSTIFPEMVCTYLRGETC